MCVLSSLSNIYCNAAFPLFHWRCRRACKCTWDNIKTGCLVLENVEFMHISCFIGHWWFRIICDDRPKKFIVARQVSCFGSDTFNIHLLVIICRCSGHSLVIKAGNECIVSIFNHNLLQIGSIFVQNMQCLHFL